MKIGRCAIPKTWRILRLECGPDGLHWLEMLRQFLSAAIVVLLIGLAACSLKPRWAASAGAAPPAVLIAPVEQRTVPVFGEFVARTDSPASVAMAALVRSARTR
jgi:hypothetical protein